LLFLRERSTLLSLVLYIATIRYILNSSAA
jgi:hypothetical protein